MVLEGGCELITDQEVTQLCKGDAVQVAVGTPHTHRGDPNHRTRQLVILAL